MFFGLSEEQEQFQDYVKKFLTDNVTVDEIEKLQMEKTKLFSKRSILA